MTHQGINRLPELSWRRTFGIHFSLPEGLSFQFRSLQIVVAVTVSVRSARRARCSSRQYSRSCVRGEVATREQPANTSNLPVAVTFPMLSVILKPWSMVAFAVGCFTAGLLVAITITASVAVASHH